MEREELIERQIRALDAGRFTEADWLEALIRKIDTTTTQCKLCGAAERHWLMYTSIPPNT